MMMMMMIVMMIMIVILMNITRMFTVSGLSGSVAGRHPPAGSHTLGVGVTVFLALTPRALSVIQGGLVTVFLATTYTCQ